MVMTEMPVPRTERAAAGPSRPPRPPRSAEERDALLADLEGRETWPAAAASLLAELGFRLVGPEGSGREHWHLLVALRDQPTLRHFDPEFVAYYAATATGADLVQLERPAATAGQPAGTPASFLWGQIHVVDRVPVENRFLTFGGELRVAAYDQALTVVDLVSPAPIVRWGGHSQGTDDLTDAIGAFFGRLLVPIDFVPGAEARIDAQPAGVLYRAFLADGLHRAAAAERRGLEQAPLGAWLSAAWLRARRDAPACDAAQRLLRDLVVPTAA